MKNTLLILFVLSSLTLSAQSFTVELSSDSILLGSYFELKFTIENTEADFEAPQFEKLQIVAGPNYSSSVQIINNEKSSKRTISYYLKPTELGQFYIPPAYVVEGELTLETEALQINVYPNPDGIIENSTLDDNSGFGSFEWSFSSPFNERPKVEKPKSKSKQKLRKI